MGGLDLILACMEEFDSGVKEAAAFVLGYIARQDLTLALAVVGSGTKILDYFQLTPKYLSVAQYMLQFSQMNVMFFASWYYYMRSSRL